MHKKIFLVFIIVLMISSPIYATNWKPINYSNPNLIKESGLTIEEFNGLSQTEWLELFNNKEMVNFAFSATNSEGEDVTNDINPDLSIIINGNNDSKSVSFAKITIPADQPPSGEKIDSLNDKDEDGYLDIWYLEQLAYIGKNSTTLSEKYELMRDLDFKNPSHYLHPEESLSLWTNNTGWTPIGTTSSRFRGELDGNKFKIINLYINNPNVNYQGLFGSIHNSVIKNLDISNINVVGHDMVGGLTGHSYDYGKINNVSVDGSVSGNKAVGGVIGMLKRRGDSQVSNSNFTGSVVGNNETGGFIGYLFNSHHQSNISIKNSYVLGEVSGGYKTGGFVGFAKETSLENCYTKTIVEGNDWAGGFLGKSEGKATGRVHINNSYSSSEVIGNTNIGVFTSKNSKYIYPNNSFWEEEISENSISSIGTSLTTSEMKTAQTFIDAGWDTDIWELKDGQYPKLKWE
ncbi:MAG: hypothetical protein ACOCV1_08630 [Bacillota bacterium]